MTPDEQYLTDLQREVASTKSPGAAASTAFNGIVQQLETIDRETQDQPHLYAGRVRSFVAFLSGCRTGMSDAICANTDAEGMKDPDAPAPASNPGSAGGNVYGSEGPSDPNNMANSSAGYAGSDVSVSDANAAPLTPAPDHVPAPDAPTAADPTTSRRNDFNAAEQAEHDREFPDAGKQATTDGGTAPIGLVHGDPAPEQDKPAGAGEDMSRSKAEIVNFADGGAGPK